MPGPLFSIVTVTLNCAADACRTAQSVLEQDCGDFEYLVKDGGSSDQTVERLQAMGVRAIHVCQDRGIYPAMNQALALCQGRYVWYLNAGDTFASPAVLSQFASHIQRRGFPAFVYGDYQTMQRHPFWQDGAPSQPRQLRMRGRLSRFYLYRRTICHQAWAVARSLYEGCGGLDEGLRFAADYDFLLRAILRLGVSYLRVPVVCVTYAGGGDSERNFERASLESRQVRRGYFWAPERWAYEAASRAARLVVHSRGFSRLQRRLPAPWQAMLAGL